MARKKQPTIIILATGGTIAGVTTTKSATTNYKAGAITIRTLLAQIPESTKLGHIKTEQISNIDSADMTSALWLKLAQRINILMKQDNISGIVLTHGSDTMEESAFFLHLVVNSNKPVVLTGAMRPSTAASADGAKNLYNAIALAANPDAQGKGVMIVFNDRIQSARYATKIHTLNPDAFSSPNCGDMGYMIDGKAYFYYTPLYPHTKRSIFRVDSLATLPKVDILYSYTDDGSGVAAQALYATGTQGLVIAGSGSGSIHRNQKDVLKKLIQQGFVVVRSSRINAGLIATNAQDSKLGFISAKDLNPQKARILLLLALTQTNNHKEIEKIFECY